MQGQTGHVRSKRNAGILNASLLSWGGAWALTAGEGIWGKQCCLLLYLHSSWVPAFEGCWMLDMGLRGRLVGPSAAVCVFSSLCSNLGRAELQFSGVCVMYWNNHGRGLVALLPSYLLKAPAQAPSGPSGWWWWWPSRRLSEHHCGLARDKKWP